MNRRTFVTGSLAGAALTLLPIQLTPARAAGLTRRTVLRFHGVGALARAHAASPGFQDAVAQWGDPVACLGQLYNGMYDTVPWAPVPHNRMMLLYEELYQRGWASAVGLLTRTYQFQHPGEPAVTINQPRLPGDHTWVALKRYKQIELVFKAFVVRPPTAVEAGRLMDQVIETTAPQTLASSRWSAAHAQTLDVGTLEPIYVVAPFDSGSWDPGVVYSTTYNSQMLMQIRMYNLWLQRQDAARKAEILSHPEAAFYGGAAAQKVRAELGRQGLTEAQQLAVLNALGAAFGLLPTGATVAFAGMELIGNGLAAGTIGIAVVTTGVGAVVTITGVAMVLVGLYLFTIVVGNMIPAMPGVTGFPLPTGWPALPETSTAIIDVPAAWATEAATYPDADPEALSPYQWEE